MLDPGSDPNTTPCILHGSIRHAKDGETVYGVVSFSYHAAFVVRYGLPPVDTIF